MIQDIIIPFLAVGLAELGDKTQICVFALASKTKRYLLLLLGIALGFALADGLAIILGDFLTNVIPKKILAIIAGLVFIVFGLLAFLAKDSDKEKCDLKTPFMTGFIFILLSEMGDKTQIASGLFATRYHPLLVFIGVMGALIILSVIAIYLGKTLLSKIDKRKVSIFSGIIFILIGIATLFGF